MNFKEKAMRQEARERIIEYLKEGYDDYYSDLGYEVFDYYVVGTYQAKKILEEFGIWDAIAKVQTYEKDNFGEVYINLSDPEKVANMLFYIIGEEVLWDMLSESETLKKEYEEGTKADEDTNAAILEELGE